ncbi:MAG: EamA family transporter RarD [Candidatus Eisenbacteria bacterium]|nr:EamA family transporter RarD [Candidatus Eisenbacteria bacterium]
MKRGILYGIAAYTLWGLFPLYWRFLSPIPATEILCHRVVWSFLFLGIILVRKNRLKSWLHKSRKSVTILYFFLTACLLSLNWGIFIWAVNSNYVVEASLGYFINPLVNVLLGVIFLGERPRFLQWFAIGIAAAAVLFLTFGYGSFPWIALTLAFSFGLYALLRKIGALSSLEGLSLEMTLLFVPALAYLLYCQHAGTAAFGHVSAIKTLLLALTGIVTAVPLLLFGSAARRISLTNVGLLQYISPTFQFLIGVIVFGEALTSARLAGFVAVWISLALYTFESLRTNAPIPELETYKETCRT